MKHLMTLRITLALIVFVCALWGAKVKTKSYAQPESCFRTYRLVTGRVLTSRGLVEDPTVNAIMKDAVSKQMQGLKISEAGKSADIEVRFIGGSSAGLQVDDLDVGAVAMWNIGGPVSVNGRTYTTSNLGIAIVENSSNHTIWAASCTDKFGDPAHLQERIQKAVAKAFSKLPKNLACGA
jgi:hypothetical protein